MEPCNLRRCKNGGHEYVPDPYNAWHQEFCTREECRKASKTHSQKKWLAKNPGHFSGSANVKRVQNWSRAMRTCTTSVACWGTHRLRRSGTT